MYNICICVFITSFLYGYNHACINIRRGALVQNVYVQGLKKTSATFATAIINLIPATTFVLSVCFGLESFSVTTTAGIAKIAGTLLGLGGAMLLTFYKGPDLNLWSNPIDLLQNHHKSQATNSSPGNMVVGSLLCVASSISMSVWFIIQVMYIYL